MVGLVLDTTVFQSFLQCCKHNHTTGYLAEGLYSLLLVVSCFVLVQIRAIVSRISFYH